MSLYIKVRFDYMTGASGLEIAGAALLEDGREISRDMHDGFAGVQPSLTVYTLEVSTPKPGVLYRLCARVAGAGGTNSHGTVSWVLR